MADERLRELERRWKETGALADEQAYLRERARAGSTKAYSFLHGRLNDPYGDALHLLRSECDADVSSPQPMHKIDGKLMYRPLTFAETMRARVEEFNRLSNPDGTERSLDERLALWNTSLGTCTGVVRKRGSNKFKIIPVCEELLRLQQNSPDEKWPSVLCCEYEHLDGKEFNCRNSRYRYGINRGSTEEKVLAHAAWIEVAKETVPDPELLREYSRIAFALLEERCKALSRPWSQEGMSFEVPVRKEDQDNLQTLHAPYHLAGAHAYNLIEPGRFVRVHWAGE